MPAGEHTFICQPGETFRRTLTWKAGTPPAPVDVTGYSGRMQIRSEPTTAVLAELNSAGGHQGTITFGTTDGRITLLLPANITATLPPRVYYYDLFVTAPGGGDTTALLAGAFQVPVAVTHD